MAKTVAELHEVVIRHHGRTILGPLSITLDKGDFLGIIGPNGAGKSTLLRTLAGQEPVHSGHVALMGHITGQNSGYKTSPRHIQKHLGILLQHHDFFPDMPFTVEDIVLFGRLRKTRTGRPYRVSDKQAAAQALSYMGMSEFHRRLYRELSGGEQRKVHLARLIAQEPDLLLLDEPTSGLDIDWQERLTGLVENMYRRLGKTVVMVTHDIDRLPACCNKTLLLKNGKTLATGSPDEVFTQEILSLLYGCSVEVAVRNGRYHAFSLGLMESQ